MGRKSSPPPNIIRSEAAKPPQLTQVPSQSVQPQTALNDAANKQTRLNMELGDQLDRTNADFFDTQDIRRTQATAAENRLTTRVAGEETRGTIRTQGQEDRALTATTGLEYRRGLETAGSQDRALTRTTGQESRATQ